MKTLTINKRSIIAIGVVTILVSLLIPQTAMAKLPAGIDPNHPIQIAVVPGQTMAKTGKLAAGQEAWFSVKVSDVYNRFTDDEDGEDRPPLDLTLFVTPVDGNKARHIRMDLFPGNYAGHWSAGHLYKESLDYSDDDNDLPPAPFGVGRMVDRAVEDDVYINVQGDPLLGQLTWSGRVTDNEFFLVRISNGNGSAVDYTLYTDDIIDVEF
jgi:hypothetical protein